MRLKIAILVLLIVVFVVVGLISFSGNAPESSAIDQDRFVQAYVELATLAETLPIGTPEYEREKARVLGEMGLQPSEVEDALALYNNRPELWRPVWERIQEELARRGEGITGGAEATGATDSL